MLFNNLNLKINVKEKQKPLNKGHTQSNLTDTHQETQAAS